jgi:hypothetical protein
MGYDDPKFIGLSYTTPPTFPALSQTFTASDHVVTSTEAAPNALLVPDACFFANGVVWISTVGTSKDAYVILLQSGTTVLATATPANTAGSGAVFTTLSGNSNSIPAGGTLAVAIKGTGTASATQTSPVLRMTLSFQRQFV